MTPATTEVVSRTPASRPSLVSVGTIVRLSSELMFFAGLFAMYFTVRAVDKGMGRDWPLAHDATAGAKVLFGPATRPLPQLPMTTDAQGFLVARSDFREAVGPSFWERS